MMQWLVWILERAGLAEDPSRKRASEAGQERLRELERRVNVLDATIGAQQAQQTKERHRRDTEGERRATQ